MLRAFLVGALVPQGEEGFTARAFELHLYGLTASKQLAALWTPDLL